MAYDFPIPSMRLQAVNRLPMKKYTGVPGDRKRGCLKVTYPRKNSATSQGRKGKEARGLFEPGSLPRTQKRTFLMQGPSSLGKGGLAWKEGVDKGFAATGHGGGLLL